MANDIEQFRAEEMQSPFDSIKETDAESREWWNSRKLARLIGYQKYWNFERLMEKVATNVTVQDISYHLIQLNDTGDVQLSTSIKRILNPSDNCEDAGTIMYNLDTIIAVGYRVNSYEATQS